MYTVFKLDFIVVVAKAFDNDKSSIFKLLAVIIMINSKQFNDPTIVNIEIQHRMCVFCFTCF